jgi:ankyrin repeat protein
MSDILLKFITEDTEFQEHCALRAIHFNNYEVLKILLDHGLSPDSFNKNMTTFLSIAVKHNHLEIAELLLQSGANPNYTNCDDKLPLLLAIRNNDIPMTNLLLKYGVENYEFFNESYLSRSIKFHAWNIVPILIDLWPVSDPWLLDQCINEDAPLEIIKLIIHEYPPDLTLQDYQGTILHRATIKGSYEVVNLLLNLGADPLLKNDENKIAKDYALDSNLYSILKSYENIFDLKEPGK